MPRLAVALLSLGCPLVQMAATAWLIRLVQYYEGSQHAPAFPLLMLSAFVAFAVGTGGLWLGGEMKSRFRALAYGFTLAMLLTAMFFCCVVWIALERVGGQLPPPLAW